MSRIGLSGIVDADTYAWADNTAASGGDHAPWASTHPQAAMSCGFLRAPGRTWQRLAVRLAAPQIPLVVCLCELHVTAHTGGTVCDLAGCGARARAAPAGAVWTRQTASAPWSAQHDHALVALPNDGLLLIEAISPAAWRSDDLGLTWSQVASGPTAGFGLRDKPAAVALADGLVVLMGGSTPGKNDVWHGHDGGTTWIQVNSDAPWTARRAPAAALLADGRTIVLAGGHLDSVVWQDVWRSTDTGRSWELATSSAEWGSVEFYPRMLPLPDGRLVVVLGPGVWRSNDAGASFTQLPAPPWPFNTRQGAVVLGGALLLAGGTGSGQAWQSTDGGSSWTVLSSSPGWGSRFGSALAATSSGHIVLTGGYPDTNDVWISRAVEPATEWYSANCNDGKRGMCGAPPGTAGVTVGLRAAAGTVVPSNAGSNDWPRAGVVYAPPVPTITLSTGTPTASSQAIFNFDATFSSGVSGLQPTDFNVGVGHAATLSMALTGAATEWRLSVVVDPVSVSGRDCPAGYSASPTSSGGSVWCARLLRSQTSWSAAEAACGPYHLASVHSSEQQALLADVGRVWHLGYW